MRRASSAKPAKRQQPRRVGAGARMSKSCKGLLDELVRCLSESDCVRKQGKTHAECAAVNDTRSVPARCLGIRATYAKCKLGQLDMRTRIRGNKGY